MNDVPLVRSPHPRDPARPHPAHFLPCVSQGFGVLAHSTANCRKLDPTAIVAFHQADVGEYLRNEDTLT